MRLDGFTSFEGGLLQLDFIFFFVCTVYVYWILLERMLTLSLSPSRSVALICVTLFTATKPIWIINSFDCNFFLSVVHTYTYTRSFAVSHSISLFRSLLFFLRASLLFYLKQSNCLISALYTAYGHHKIELSINWFSRGLSCLFQLWF